VADNEGAGRFIHLCPSFFMALLDKELIVKRSTLPGAGKGLFTRVSIAKGTRITEYKGKRMTWAEAQKLPDERNGYLFYFSRNHVIDAWGTSKGVAHYANDARGLRRVEGIRNNSEYVTEGKRCYIQASRNIVAGEEILVAYGAEYWQVIRHNLREELKDKHKHKTPNKAAKDLERMVREGKASLPHHQAAKRLARH
jgi:SET domain-containing protein